MFGEPYGQLIGAHILGPRATEIIAECGMLRDICEAVSIPVVAIGGIDETNIMQLAGTHCSGVSIISAIFGKEDIKGATMKLRSLSEKMITAL